MVTAKAQGTSSYQPPMGQQADSSNPATLQRLVGFHEYGQAIDMFDELMSISTAEEIATYDKLIKSRQEFTVYTNLSRLAGEQPNAFSQFNSTNRDNARRGLAWVMSLARLELFAMISVYGSPEQRASLRPPSTLERHAFRELLFDGMRTHIWALNNDKRYEGVTERTPDAETIAYARRLMLVARFIQSVARFHGDDLTNEQRALLSKWGRKIDSQKAELLEKIRDYLARTKKRVVSDSELMRCMRDCATELTTINAFGR